MFKPITNPYIVGNPIRTSDMFYGRQDDFEFIKRKLESGEKSYIFVLCGERRSGKTSILFQILSGRLGDNFIPILVDMQTMAGLKNEREFFEKFAQETQKSLDEKIDINRYFKTSDSSFKAFTKFVNDIHAGHPNKHILFLIDEYELIEAKINEGSLSENFIPYLAGLLESEILLSFIFTGSTKLEERKNKIWQILFAKSLFRNVSYLSRDDTLRLIQEPVKEQIEYTTEALNQIYKLTAGQPFYTQVVCQNIVDYVNQTQNNKIQEENLDIVVGEILENPLPQMIYFWNSQSDDKKLVFSLLGELLDKPDNWITAQEIIKQSKQRKFGLNLNEKAINITLEALFHSKHLGKSQSGYKFQMDLFRRWIKRDHAIWRVIKEVSALGMASSVEQQVYHSDRENGEKKKKGLLIYSSIFLVFVIVAGWWFLAPNGEQPDNIDDDISARKVENRNNNLNTREESPDDELLSEKIPGEPETGDNNSERGENVIPDKEVDETKVQPVKKNQIESQPGSAADRRPVPAPGKSGADQARDKMKSAYDQAIKNEADQLAESEFNMAKSAENEAVQSYAGEDYGRAEEAFNRASKLYNDAIRISAEAAALRMKADEAKSGLNSTKSKLTAKHRSLNSYSIAQNLENEADELYKNGEYGQAAAKYNSAKIAFDQLILSYEQDVIGIYRVINGYLDAIENEDIDGMKNAYRNLSGDFERDWKQLFKAASGIRVTRSVKSIDFIDNSARALVEVKLTYDGMNEGKLNHWQFSMKKLDKNWIISNVSEGN